jgi:WhiB family redox-sensing transcriptional regulator
MAAMGTDPMTDWRNAAACTDLPLEIFFPKPGPKLYKQTQQAKAICESCPVSVDCLEYAMSFVRGRYIMLPGIYGGTTEQERWKLARTHVINSR